MARQCLQCTLWFVLILLSLGAYSANAGTLTGKVTTAVEDAKIKDAVVWTEPIGPMPTFPPPTQPAKMAQVNLAFTPRVLPVLVGTTVDFPNRDKVYHSIFSFSRRQRFEIGLYKPGMNRSVTFDKIGPVKLFCNIHDQMFGSILVLPTPYFSLTTADGVFTIPDILAGDYTVQVWHERLQGTPQTVSMTAEGTAELSFALQPKRRDKRSRR